MGKAAMNTTEHIFVQGKREKALPSADGQSWWLAQPANGFTQVAAEKFKDDVCAMPSLHEPNRDLWV
jgi:hypothetical protein